ncbi:MAG: peroxidase-related enzyme [Actinomycetota bacterium]
MPDGTTDDLPISRFPVPELDDLPDDLREKILGIQEKSGFVPNVFLALAHRPDEARAFFDYHDALMEREGGLTAADKELIVVVTSASNDCLYCVVAHGAILRIRAKDPHLADQVATNWRKAPLTSRQRAIVEFALRVAQDSASVEDEHLDALRAEGLDDDDIWDVGAIAALFALSNRMANLTSMRPNAEFFTLGRAPRGSSG